MDSSISPQDNTPQKRVPWNKKEHAQIVCVTCGKTFTVKPYMAGTRQYCNRVCKGMAIRGKPIPANAHQGLWTEGELEILRANFPHMSIQDLCILLPSRSPYSIQTKGNKLGLVRTKEYRLNYLSTNRQNAIEAMRGRTPWNKMENIHKTCESCGKSFDVPHGDKHRRFCNRACANVWKSTRRGTDHPLYKPPAERICQWCRNTFYCKPAVVTYGEGLYCSRSCLGSAKTALQNGRRSSLEIAVEQVLIDLEESFEPQKKIGWWSVDFYLPERNMILECDGVYWHGLAKVVAQDIRKNAYWLKHGYQVLRIGEEAIKTDVHKAVTEGLARGSLL